MAAQGEALPTWSDQMEALKEIGDRLLASAARGGSDAERQEMYRYILGSLTNGYLIWGIMQMRWNHCSDAPEPRVTKVPLEAVHRHLPADTPRVTATERAEQLRRRCEAAQLRRLW